ncbi:MAG: tRNA (guanosine(46)-N7)-methyltransferase TrmB, partial [Spirochaetales bacterium]|nr:tRNA (guanosine(46)-N7)-methyltransferase TrmB [Spirochaetales bacterium]
MIEENEILEKLKLVEVRTGKDRTIKSYVLRNNLLSEEGREIVLSTFPEFGVFFDKDKKLSSQCLFNNDLPLILEIGFGMGASTQIVAEQNPDTNYLGLEVYLEGVVRLLRDSKRRELKNLKIM